MKGGVKIKMMQQGNGYSFFGAMLDVFMGVFTMLLIEELFD